jgi:hypothetical protein
VESLKFLGIHIIDKMKWSTHTDSMVKKAQQCLFNLRRLKKFVLAPKIPTNLYRCTIESLLLSCINTWYGNCIAHTSLQRVVRSAQYITGGKLPDGTGRPKRSPRTTATRVTACSPPAIIQKARSVQVHQSWNQETEKQLLSQGHQTVK